MEMMGVSSFHTFQAARTDWAVWRLMHWASLLQPRKPEKEAGDPQDFRMELEIEKRCSPPCSCARKKQVYTRNGLHWVVSSHYRTDGLSQRKSKPEAKDAALTLVTDVKQAVETVQAAKGAAEDLSSAGASAARASSPRRVKIRCIEAPQRLGVEAMVAKYLALASVAHLGVTTVWLDLDVFVLTDPSSFVFEELGNTSEPWCHQHHGNPRPPDLARPGPPCTSHRRALLRMICCARHADVSAKAARHLHGNLDEPGELVFARHQLSASISPAVLLARGSHKAASLLMGYAGWLRENPYLLDHQGWDQYLTNNDGDFAGLFDYKGRNTTTQDPYAPGHTFLASSGLAPLGHVPTDSSAMAFLDCGIPIDKVERPEEEEDKTLLDSGSQRLHLQVESLTPMPLNCSGTFLGALSWLVGASERALVYLAPGAWRRPEASVSRGRRRVMACDGSKFSANSCSSSIMDCATKGKLDSIETIVSQKKRQVGAVQQKFKVPELCCCFRKKAHEFCWADLVSGFHDACTDYKRDRVGPHEVSVEITLGRALALDDPIGQVYGGEDHHFPLKHPNYAFIGARHQLRRVHLALYKKYKYLDFDKDLTIFSSNLLAMTESEMKTYALLIRMLEKFYWKRLLRPEVDDETHGQQRSQEQARQVLRSYRHFCPVTFAALRQRGIEESLLKIVDQWLRSFFCFGWDPRPQHMGNFRRLIKVLFKVKVDESDPFRDLRRIGVCLLMQNSDKLLEACDHRASARDLEAIAKRVVLGRSFFQVLAEMNCSDMGFSTEDSVALLPLGVAGGWCSMLELDNVLPGSGLVIPAACACMGLAAVYKEGLGKLDDEDEADESLEVNLDEEVTFDFLLGTGKWQTSLRLTYDAVMSMELNPPPFAGDLTSLPLQAMDFAQAMAFLDCNIPIEKVLRRNSSPLQGPRICRFRRDWRFQRFDSGQVQLIGDLFCGNFTGIPTVETGQQEMFEMFYPKRAAFSSLSEKALKTILRYQKQPVSTPKVSTLLKGQKKLYIVAISYAHGCCAKSLKRNRDQALRVGVDEARSYGDLMEIALEPVSVCNA
ncbi:unnamed protein product [Durusdinium trenchii]|uniref:Uncharacterized protein n=1 Tax=Durusdinium trenchii TaxID=1381693 RepID=A0ABP0LTI5_9DINO